MASFEFQISYDTDQLPAWEASRALRGVTHIYYYGLIARNEQYARGLNTIFSTNLLIPEDLSNQLQITQEDQLFLEVSTRYSRLDVRASNNNDKEVIHASNALQALKKLLERLQRERESNGKTAAIKITDIMKRERLEGDQEFQQKFLRYIHESQLDQDLKRNIQNAALASGVSLLADTITSFEFTFQADNSV